MHILKKKKKRTKGKVEIVLSLSLSLSTVLSTPPSASYPTAAVKSMAVDSPGARTPPRWLMLSQHGVSSPFGLGMNSNSHSTCPQHVMRKYGRMEYGDMVEHEMGQR